MKLIDVHKAFASHEQCPSLLSGAPSPRPQLYLADPDGCVLCFQWQAQGQARALSHLRSRDQRSSPHSHFVNVVSTFRSEPAW